ncbi:MAG TPA: cupin domain-containing protein [Pyrinomonadaceae bacterium]|nr:cupin domain-containing protein [Pyrinomonadaceae bacterium]
MDTQAPMRLEQLLSPLAVDEFLTNFWGQTFKHVPGTPDKFSHLLPWQRLNEALEQHRLDFPRIRLTRDGERLPPGSYIRHSNPGQKRVAVPRLRYEKLTQELSSGATLVLDAVDELYGPLRALAEALELFFHERIQINAYASWRTSRGFDLHWDDHDVFILQVTGRKQWMVHGMTLAHPLAGDPKEPKPTEPPLWDHVLEAGDLLYIPRGFWHVAYPLNEPTLHLTVGVHNRAGLDLLRWLVNRLRSREVFRMDLPRFATREAIEAHLAEMRSELLAEWDDDILNRYFADLDASAVSRPRLSLACAPVAGSLPAGNMLVRLLAPRPLDLKVESGVVSFSSQRKAWRLAVEALPLLRHLDKHRVCSVSELCEVAKSEVDERRVRMFLKELLMNGLVAIVEP